MTCNSDGYSERPEKVVGAMEFIYQDPKTSSASEDALAKLDPEQPIVGMDPKEAYDLVSLTGRSLDPTPCRVKFINNPGRAGITPDTPGKRESRILRRPASCGTKARCRTKGGRRFESLCRFVPSVRRATQG